jgi:hypothetical protein
MCGAQPSFRWLSQSERRIFTLAPFQIVGSSDVLSKGLSTSGRSNPSDAWLVVSAFDGRARVSRVQGTKTRAQKGAEAQAQATGDCTILGRQVGTVEGGLPVFEAVGQVLTAKVDPMSPEALEEWAMRLAEEMVGASRAEMAAMTSEAMGHLALDYAGVSQAQLDAAIAGYRTTISNPSGAMLRAQRIEMTRSLERVLRRVGVTARGMPQIRGNLAAGWSVPDKRASQLLSRHHGFFVRDRHGSISQSMSARARTIISDGVNRGYGRREIGRQLAQMTSSGVRQPHYYRTVAGVQVARARSYSLGSTMRAAGVQFHRIEAVLDDRTTHQCVFLHGKVMPVGAAMSQMEAVMRNPDPEAVVTGTPFIQDEGDSLTVPTAGGGSTTIARIDQRAVPADGTRATFSQGFSSADLVDAAIGLPPYHFGCRTTAITIVS